MDKTYIPFINCSWVVCSQLAGVREHACATWLLAWPRFHSRATSTIKRLGQLARTEYHLMLERATGRAGKRRRHALVRRGGTAQHFCPVAWHSPSSYFVALDNQILI